MHLSTLCPLAKKSIKYLISLNTQQNIIDYGHKQNTISTSTSSSNSIHNTNNLKLLTKP
jgi:hypothetical protein